MQIKGLTLKNIRSYLDEHVEFPQGTILLSGDIGSGKSTLLYALDFALFGITKELSGNSLLRHGAKDGSVELHFDVDGKDVVIQRTLKRGSSVTQHAGYLVIDGMKRELTPLELKQKILELLQYPQELLTKKSLIYRYTVYTPQDEMKSILLADQSDRVDTLRKVFGIDKYKRIHDHAEIFLKMLRARVRALQDRLGVQPEKEQRAHSLREQLRSLQKDIETLTLPLRRAQRDISAMKQHITLGEKDLAFFHEQQRELRAVETALLHYRQDEQQARTALSAFEQDITHLERDLHAKDVSFNREKLTNTEEKLRRTEEKLREIQSKKQECAVRIATSKKHLSDLEQLEVCPLCTQKVSATHKKNVSATEQEKIATQTALMKTLEHEGAMLQQPLEQLKQELDRLKALSHTQELLQFKRKMLDEKQQRIREFQALAAKSMRQIAEAEATSHTLRERTRTFEHKEKELHTFRQRLEQFQEEERAYLMQKVSLEKEKSVLERDVQNLEEELLELKRFEQQMQGLLQFREWLEICFVPLMEVLERQVMLKVHRDFDLLFQKWFGMLVESELMKVRLDESFSPIIEQNGYETDYTFLSGGEKTAAALAYRLALNQVINNIVGVVKTRDVLILDEPTDGFSNEQLDRMRDVLDELDAKQIILVSHEDKIESFVDSVIRVEKENHVSRIIM